MSCTFNFYAQEWLDQSPLFYLKKKTNEEKNFYVIIEKLPNYDTFYIEHCDGTNVFCIRKDKKQVGKNETKNKKSTNKSRISQLKWEKSC